jgi:hypothetical protein
MADYGHDLLFGTFVTPTAEPAEHAVRLAEASEAAGLDLVTFQDHPYQPRFLDTWTLLSYVAARTVSIRLAANVTNLPLRPPAVLARSVASLDLLSHGRMALGIGAGAFWDAIEAMGGPRLAAGQSVQALDEAITVIREIWDTEARGGVRVDGEHYRVVGAKRGPAPAHPVPVWVGAYGPRMLRLVGRRADGWLPSLGYLSGREALTDLNRTIDDAAREAGRRPEDVRRLLNVGSADVSVDSLTDLVLGYGVSGLVLGTDDEAEVQRFGLEVAPAVRAAVLAARDGTTAPAVLATGTVSGVPAPGLVTDLGVAATVDDGQRHSATMPWDEATRPNAPHDPATADYTDQGRAVAQHLVDVHDGLRTELAQVRDLLEQVRNGLAPGAARSALNDLTLRQNNWTLGAYCQSYCRFVTGHHALEDRQIFPHLRATAEGLSPVIDRLAEEHVVIHGVVDAVDQALVRLAEAPGDLAPLEQAVDLLTDTLLSHLSYEERELLGPLGRHGFYPGQV